MSNKSALTALIMSAFLASLVPAHALAAGQSKVLIDAASNLSTNEWKVTSAEWGKAGSAKWSVEVKTLHGGRQEGVHVIDVDNGKMKFRIVPERGFGIWNAQSGDIRLGWDSPVQEIVHPLYIDLNDRGGLGWLNGFGGWVVRTGLGNVGAPGSDNGTPVNLHGNIDALPASFVEVSYEASPEPRLVFKGIVNDTQMFGPNLRLTSIISTPIGSSKIGFDDEVTNLKSVDQEFESLYHVNFGTPLEGKGAEFIAPVKHVAPRDPRAAEGIADWSKYTGPHPAGYTEQVYLMELYPDAEGVTEAMLKAPDGKSAALMTVGVQGLPYFSLWKNEAPEGTGYVTGLEPATSFPYPRNVERDHGRVPKLAGGASAKMKLDIEVLDTSDKVSKAEADIRALQKAPAEVQQTPLVGK